MVYNGIYIYMAIAARLVAFSKHPNVVPTWRIWATLEKSNFSPANLHRPKGQHFFARQKGTPFTDFTTKSVGKGGYFTKPTKNMGYCLVEHGWTNRTADLASMLAYEHRRWDYNWICTNQSWRFVQHMDWCFSGSCEDKGSGRRDRRWEKACFCSIESWWVGHMAPSKSGTYCQRLSLFLLWIGPIFSWVFDGFRFCDIFIHIHHPKWTLPTPGVVHPAQTRWPKSRDTKLRSCKCAQESCEVCHNSNILLMCRHVYPNVLKIILSLLCAVNIMRTHTHAVICMHPRMQHYVT